MQFHGKFLALHMFMCLNFSAILIQAFQCDFLYVLHLASKCTHRHLGFMLNIRVQSADCNDDENRNELKKLSLPGGGGRLAKPLECMHESGLWIWWELYSVIFPFSYSAFYISIPLVPQHLLLLPQCPLFLYKNAFEQKSLTWTWKKPINTCLREYTCFYPDNY